MKVILLSDYYPPFNPGGSEWSTHYLADSLIKNGTEVVVITPNYGAVDCEVVKGINVIRFGTPFKLKDNRSVINPVFQNNPLFFFGSAFAIVKYALLEKADILQVNGKYLIPGAFLASKILHKPLIVSIRDKQLLCSYGRCFFTKGRLKRCGWLEYLSVDLGWFYKNYVKNKNLGTLIYTYLSAIWTRLMNDIIGGFAKRADAIVAISKSQKDYLKENGYQKVEVIYNSIEFPRSFKKVKRRGVLYAGKLSLGKGVYELIDAIPEIIKEYKEPFLFVGGIDDKRKIDQLINKDKISKYVNLLGGVDHFKLRKLYSQAKLVVMPSIFPEAFGRVALEALAEGTPVVVADRGGLPEIVENNITGIISDVTAKALATAIKKILRVNDRYLKKVADRREQLISKFEINPINQHLKLYRKLTKKNA